METERQTARETSERMRANLQSEATLTKSMPSNISYSLTNLSCSSQPIIHTACSLQSPNPKHQSFILFISTNREGTNSWCKIQTCSTNHASLLSPFLSGFQAVFTGVECLNFRCHSRGWEWDKVKANEVIPQIYHNIPQIYHNIPQYTTNIPQYTTNIAQYTTIYHKYSTIYHKYTTIYHKYSTNIPQYTTNIPQYTTNIPQYTTNIPQNHVLNPHPLSRSQAALAGVLHDGVPGLGLRGGGREAAAGHGAVLQHGRIPTPRPLRAGRAADVRAPPVQGPARVLTRRSGEPGA
jgi:hypothetical protein